MDHASSKLPPELVPAGPGIEVLRLAALLADGKALDGETMDAMHAEVQTGALESVSLADAWREFERGLMARAPALMIQALQASGALQIVLPEVASLFGVPQIADEPGQVDIGEHVLAALNGAAQSGAPLEVRFALLTMNVGKSDSPREHLPVHSRHIERGRPRIEAICERFAVPAACRDLALLALAECERVHRVSRVRAGPVAAMLERIGAFADPARLPPLLSVCSCDYFAFKGRSEAIYPKAQLLRTALKICSEIDATAFESTEDLHAARAVAIAKAFRSRRWSSEALE